YKIKNQIIQPFNNLRLRTKDADNYFNTGIVLMNIQKLREERTPKEISEAVVDNKAILILPDQDVFNYLYFNEVKENPWEIYNVDPRLYQVFQLINPEKYNLGWVEDEVILFIMQVNTSHGWNVRNINGIWVNIILNMKRC